MGCFSEIKHDLFFLVALLSRISNPWNDVWCFQPHQMNFAMMQMHASNHGLSQLCIHQHNKNYSTKSPTINDVKL